MAKSEGMLQSAFFRDFAAHALAAAAICDFLVCGIVSISFYYFKLLALEHGKNYLKTALAVFGILFFCQPIPLLYKSSGGLTHCTIVYILYLYYY